MVDMLLCFILSRCFEDYDFLDMNFEIVNFGIILVEVYVVCVFYIMGGCGILMMIIILIFVD